VGVKLLVGALKITPLLAAPATVTTTLLVNTPAGAGTSMLVSLQLVGDARSAPKVTPLVPCVLPKLVPVMVTGVPATPVEGEMLVMVGVIACVKVEEVLEASLASPP
jgi:hypothetical protein